MISNSAAALSTLIPTLDSLRHDRDALAQLLARIDEKLASYEQVRPLLVRRGPKPLFGKPMTGAERVARHRAKKAAGTKERY